MNSKNTCGSSFLVNSHEFQVDSYQQQTVMMSAPFHNLIQYFLVGFLFFVFPLI